MNFKARIKEIKQNLQVYRLLAKDPRLPRRSKILLTMAVGYLAMPFDLIPDFIPILGQLDDLVIVPALVYFALKSIPKELIEEYRKKVQAKI
jgi:uncharacterized membrane protein YkvA (DUF1232 family)